MLSALSVSHKLQLGSAEICSVSSAWLTSAAPDGAHQDELKQISIGNNTTGLSWCGKTVPTCCKKHYLLSVLHTFILWSTVCCDILPQVIVYLAFVLPDVLLISLF